MINWFKKRHQASNMDQTSNLAAKKPAGARHSWERAWVKVQDLAPGMKIAVPAASAVAPHMSGRNLELGTKNLELRTWNLENNELPSTPRGDEVALRGSEDNDTEWDEIVSIREVGEERVYDIEVDGTHNFIAGHLLDQATGDALTPEEENAVLQDEQPRHGMVYGGIFAHNTYISGNLGIGTTAPTSLLNVKGNLSSALTGTVSVAAASTTVTGTGTAFTTELVPGDSIKIGSETFNVSVISSATSLTIDGLHSAGASGVTAYRDPDLFAVYNGDNIGKFIVNKTGNVGIGTMEPEYKLSVVGSMNVSGNATVGNVLTLGNAAGAGHLLIVDDAGGSVISMNGSTGNVGIGTTAPGYQLDVSGDINSTTSLRIEGGGTIDSYTGISGATFTSAKIGLSTGSSALPANYAGAGLLVDATTFVEASSGIHDLIAAAAIRPVSVTNGAGFTTDTASLYIEDASSFALGNGYNYSLFVDDGISRFDGNVGIGAVYPVAPLHISRENANTTVDDNVNGFIRIENTDTTDNNKSFIAFTTVSTSGTLNLKGPFIGASFHDRTSSTIPGDLLLGYGSGNASVEGMRITSTGNVGIGTTAPGYLLELSGGTAYCDQASCWADASDIAFKEDIVDLSYGLADVLAMQPREYTFIPTGEHSFGFVAQELENIIPEVVIGQDGRKGISYGSLTPVLAKAIQQLNINKAENSTLGLTIDQLLPTTDAFQETSTKLTVLENQLSDYAASATTLDERLTALEETSAPAASDNSATVSSFADYGLQLLEATDELQITKDIIATQSLVLYDTLIADTAEIASALNIHGDSTIWGNLLVKSNIAVEGDLQVGGVLGVNSRQAGQAAIPRGGLTVEVTYSEPFATAPLVQITPQAQVDTQFWISQQTETGLTISLSQPTEAGITFSWIALPVENIETTQGQPLDTDGDGIIDLDDPTPNDASPTPPTLEPTVEPTPSSSLSPSPTPIPASPTPTSEPISSIAPSPSPTPSPTASPTPSPTLTPSPTPSIPQGTITIQSTNFFDDFDKEILRVRNLPNSSSQQVGAVEVGASFPYYETISGWYQLILDDGTIGWVSSQYAS